MSIFLELDGLCGGYGKKAVIKNMSFVINRGDFLGVIGPNGSGKSTLLKLMTKVLAPSSGRVIFDGRPVGQITLKTFASRVSFVPQDNLINFSFTVKEIVLMGRIPHLGRLQVETKKDHAAAERAMALTETLSIKDRNIDELSAGERQRVIVARALAQEPQLLFLDEPTSHLDIGHQMHLLDLLKGLNRDGLTIVMVLHDLNLAAEFTNRIVLISDGAIARIGAPQDVLTYQNIEEVYKTTVVVKNNPISGKPYVIPVSQELTEPIIC